MDQRRYVQTQNCQREPSVRRLAAVIGPQCQMDEVVLSRVAASGHDVIPPRERREHQSARCFYCILKLVSRLHW
jgi:hypothetical protein